MKGYAWVLASGATVLSLVSTVNGPGLSPDSVTYLSTAQNLADTGSLTTFAGRPLTVFPPGLSMIGALGPMLGVSVETWTRGFIALCALLIVITAHRLFLAVRLDGAPLALSTSAVALSPALLAITSMTWSEAPFIVIVNVTLLQLVRICGARTLSGPAGVRLALLCWAGFAFRYAGLILVVCSALVLVAALRPRKLRASVQLLAVTAGSAAGPGLWMMRNRTVDGSLMGARSDSPDELFGSLLQMLRTVGRWAVDTQEIPDRIHLAIGLLVTLAAIALGVGRVWRLGPASIEVVKSVDSARRLPLLIFVLCYPAYLIAAQLTTLIDPIDLRLMSPAHVPFIGLVASSLPQGLTERASGGTLSSRVRIMFGAAAALVALQALFSVREARTDYISGDGYNSTHWRTSAVADELQVLAGPDALIFSNDPPGTWATTRLQPIRPAPRRVGYRGVALEGEQERFVESVCSGEPGALLVLYDAQMAVTFGVAELEELADVALLAAVEDGSIYSIGATCPGG